MNNLQKKIFIFLFFTICLMPVLFFNYEKDAISDVDNKKLAENPFLKFGYGIQKNIDEYIDDRIGFRNDAILIYTMINDELFDEMVHPSYSYGKNGHVFPKFSSNKIFTKYEEDFAKFIIKLERYCNERDIEFVFMINPAKGDVYTEEVAVGFNFSNDWLSSFIKTLEDNDVNYIDNVVYLRDTYRDGIDVFNKMYNVGHWNYTGAFYGINNLANNLNIKEMGVEEIGEDEFDIEYINNDSLLVSKFPIDEDEPIYIFDNNILNKSKEYSKFINKNLDSRYRYFNYRQNLDLKNDVKALVFQSSYLNSIGDTFVENLFREYISIHNYQNVINADKFINIFKPNLVIFEMADYTFSNNYFNIDNMNKKIFNPPLENYDIKDEINLKDISYKMISENNITTIDIDNGILKDNYYFYIQYDNKIYDLIKKQDGSYSVSIEIDKIDLKEIKILKLPK